MTTAPESPEMKSVELHEIAGPEIITVDMGMPATHRCDRCIGQAYVEVETKAGELLFCVHHYNEHEAPLMLQAIRIVDHRPFLKKQEEAFKGLPATP